MRTHGAMAIVACALLAVASACSSDSDAPETSQETSPTTADTMATTTTAASEPRLDLSARPFISFTAVPPKPPEKADIPVPDGADDYWDLFKPGAPWEEVAESLDVFRIHAWQVRHIFTDDQMRSMFDALRDMDLPLAMEIEPLDPPDPDVCDHTESMEGPYDLESAQRVKDAGGVVQLVILDNPFSFGHRLQGPGSCQYPVEEVVRQVIDFLDAFREIHPNVAVVSIEGIAWPTAAEDMALWLDTYEEMAGEPFDFLEMDVNYSLRDWPELALAVEDVADSRGVPFGIIYTDQLAETNDEWLAAVASRMTTFEEVFGGTPDDVAFLSWVDQPKRVLPEDDPSAMTSLILRYLGDRTRTTFDVADGVAEGIVTTKDGRPMAGGTVEISAAPRSVVAQTLSVSGTVPSSATTALVLMRLNIETPDVGNGSFVVHDVTYTEDGSEDNLVPNPEFATDMESWGVYGEPFGDAGTIASEVGNGHSLQLEAGADQVVLVDGTPFEVTPGADFDFSATVSVPEGSFDLGSVAVAFVDAAENGRAIIDFRSDSLLSVGTATTGADGTFSIPLSLESNTYELEAVYPGDVRHWQSSASGVVDLGD
jgi:hypothetical protein